MVKHSAGFGCITSLIGILALLVLVACGQANPGAGPAPVSNQPPPTSSTSAPPTGSQTPPPGGVHRPPANLEVTPGDMSSSCTADTTSSPGCNETVQLPGGGKFEVYSNFPLAGSPAVTRAVVVSHGTSRDANGYYEHMMAAAHAAGVTDHVMVVAPHFEVCGDKPSGTVCWKANDDWKQGSTTGDGLSSFQVLDQIAASLGDQARFPNLTHITFAGHSAGGQIMQRYAVFGQAPTLLPWVDVTFAPANPSSYVYLDNQRPDESGNFAVPNGSPCGGAWNAGKYGLEGRSGYLATLTPQQLNDQYANRVVNYFNGGADTVDNGDLDTACPAMLQGPNRQLRGQWYFNHDMVLHPNAPHSYTIVPNVCHDATSMFASDLMWPALFGATKHSHERC